jgi:C1A family cysteine protease
MKKTDSVLGGNTARRYGWVPDLPDHRDILYSSVRSIPANLPPHVDLRNLCSKVEDQGQLGSCTGNALVGALEYLERKDGVPYIELSRLFIYYNERAMEHTISVDAGARIRDGIKTLASQGVCPETAWAYDVTKFAVKPLAVCYKEAIKHRVTSYQRIQSVNEMRACLADGYPFVFGFTVYGGFESQEIAKTGVVQMPLSYERPLGGHAVLGVGYDDSQKRFIVRNSWGEGWGQKGYFTIPYDYLADRTLSDDFWSIRRCEGFCK